MAEIPIVGRKRAPGPKHPEVSVTEISDGALGSLVSNITANVTANVVRNLLARFKDRCAHKDHAGPCRVTRIAHTSGTHDFIEPPAAMMERPAPLNGKRPE